MIERTARDDVGRRQPPGVVPRPLNSPPRGGFWPLRGGLASATMVGPRKDPDVTETEAPPGLLRCILPGRPRSLNAERSGTLWDHRKRTAEEREAWAWEWTALRRPASWPAGCYDGPFVVAAQPYLVRPLQDAGNCYPSVKAAVDGAVDARIVRDDDPTRLLRVTLHAPVEVRTRAEQRLVVVLSMSIPQPEES